MPATEMRIRDGMFTMDLFEAASGSVARVFAGYTTGETWNGWACPYFTRDQSLRLTEAWSELGGKAHYDDAADEFVFPPLDSTEATPERYGPVKILGRRLYPIGARAWIWDEVE